MPRTDPRALHSAIVQAGTQEGASEQMRDLVGALDMSALAQLGNTILQYEALTNEFTNMLCKIAEIWIRQKGIRNPLALLKRATPSPLGLDIEEVFANPATADEFDPCGSTLLACDANDIKIAYHRRTRQDQYKAFVSKAQMRSAFTSWEKLDALVQSIVNTLFDGNRNDEWKMSKALFGQAASDNLIINQNIAKPVDNATGKAFTKLIRTLALNMQMPGSAYNSYMTLPGAIGEPVICQTFPEDLILVIRSDVLSAIDVEVLATAFNMGRADFIGRVLTVDSFTNAAGVEQPNQLCFIGDQNVPVVITQMEETSSFWNAQALKWTYFLTMFQVWSISPFWNGVMLTTP